MIKLNVYVCSGTCGMSVANALVVTPTTFNSIHEEPTHFAYFYFHM